MRIEITMRLVGDDDSDTLLIRQKFLDVDRSNMFSGAHAVIMEHSDTLAHILLLAVARELEDGDDGT